MASTKSKPPAKKSTRAAAHTPAKKTPARKSK